MPTEPTLKEKTAKGLFWGGISNAVQQVLVFFFGIFLSRILNAEDYGMVGLLAIFTGVANVLQESGFTAALINRKEFKHEDFNAVFWFNVLVGVGLYVILFFCAPLIADYFEQPDLIWVSRIVFLSFLFGSFGTAQAAFLMKNLMVKERAKIDVFSLLLSNTAALLMALNGMAYWGIAIQVSLYIALGTFFRWYFSPWRPSFQWNMRPLKEMFPFGAKLLITGLFSQLSANIFSVLLGKFYSVQQLGYYTQGSKWTNMGGGLISGMITGVAHPIFAQVAADPLRQVRVLRKMTRLSAFVAFPLMFGLAFVGEEFVLITVSEKWIASVPLLQLLCVWAAFSPICELYKNIVISKGKSDIYMYASILFSVVQLLVLLACLQYSIFCMVAVYVFTYFVWLMVWYRLVAKQIPLRILDTIKDVLPFLIIVFFVLFCSWLLMGDVRNIYLRFAGKIVLSVILYIGIMGLSKAVVFREMIRFITNKGIEND